MAKAVGGLAAWGEIAFPRLLFAVISWMMAQARMLRDLGISRRDIEYFAKRGDVFE
jgi:hypothetical protein